MNTPFPALPTLPSLFRHGAQFGARASLIAHGRPAVHYSEWFALVDSVAGWLAANGVKRWDRVGVCLPKNEMEAIATLAVARLGAVLVNLTSKTPANRVGEIVRECDMRWLFTTTANAEALAGVAASAGCGIIAPQSVAKWPVKTIAFQDTLGGGLDDDFHPIDNDLAAILYTSGSTGRSKGVMISQRNVMDATIRVASYLRLTPADRILSVLPLSAPWGLLQWSTAILSGASVALQPVSFPVEIIKSIRSLSITGLAAMPPTWIQLVDSLEQTGETLPELRYVTSSGGVIPPRILEAFPKVFPNAEVFLTYGLTEAFRTTLVPPEWFHRKMGSLGRPCRNVDVFVVDPEIGVCGPGQRGELIHRGAAVTMGYWKDPGATAASFRPCPELRPYIGDETVHYSGDIVEIDRDGFFWFAGRKDSLIKVAGHRVSVEEVETLAAQTGLVAHAVAFGMPDPVHGHVIHTAVEPARAGAFDAESFLSHCRERMPSYMAPRRVVVWREPMPRTGTGKIDRVETIRRSAAQPLENHRAI